MHTTETCATLGCHTAAADLSEFHVCFCETVEVRELFVRAVAEHEGLRLYETPTAVWVERFPGLIYMSRKNIEQVPA